MTKISKIAKETAVKIVKSIQQLTTMTSQAVELVKSIGAEWHKATKAYSAKSVNRLAIIADVAEAMGKDDKQALEYLSRAKSVYLVLNGTPPDKYASIGIDTAEDVLLGIQGISPVSMLRALDGVLLKRKKATEAAKAKAEADAEAAAQAKAEAERIADVEAKARLESQGKKTAEVKKAVKAARTAEVTKIENEKDKAAKDAKAAKKRQDEAKSGLSDLSKEKDGVVYAGYAKLLNEVVSRINTGHFVAEELEAMFKGSEIIADAIIERQERDSKKAARK